MAQQPRSSSRTRQDGIVVWDQRGVVVRWADGEASRFSWETLRHVSGCDACLARTSPEEASTHHSPVSTLSLTL